MSIDLAEFHQAFFEEAGELLAEMETLLVGLDPSAPDTEHLNAIFRAAHSIKGGAGTFGFSEMAEVTHVLESLLDQIRKGERALRTEMVDAFLAAGDVLKSQLAGHRGEGASIPADAVLGRLRAFAAAAAVGATVPAPTVPVPAIPVAEPAADSVAPVPACYHLDFTLAPDVADKRKVIGHLREGLQRLGSVTLLRGTVDAAADARREYLLEVTTTAPEADLWELLAFVVDPAALTITPQAAPAAVAPEAEDYGFFDQLYDTVAPPATPAAQLQAATASAPSQYGRRASDRAEAAEASSIRVGVEKVDQLINLVGELVITQAMLAQTASRVDPVVYETLMNGLATLERNTRGLQESVMSIRMMPISFVFSRFPRVVRDLAAKLGKQMELKTVGEGTELDKGLIEKIADPLNHLVRNSLDHGIETPDKRVVAGKDPKGTITLRASHQGGNVVIEVNDDGAGLDRERILAKARERGMTLPETISDQEVWQLIFEAGFSTAAVVTDVSGRGVGMDVVKRNIHALGGRVEIDSVLGQGTRISVRLPLTLAILDGLSVSVGGELFIIPLTYIIESLQPKADEVKTVGGRGRVVHVRGEYLPVVALHEIFNIRPQIGEVHEGIVVILESEGRKTALFVDALVGQHQVVIKSLESNYRRVPGVSGATIMGDGRVALILDPVAIAQAAQPALAQAA